MSGVRRAQVRIFGRVQGVGYRYFVHRAARTLKLTGYVLNQPDGSVLVEAQGPQPSVDELLQELHFGPSQAAVDHLTVDWIEPGKQDKGFEIRFG